MKRTILEDLNWARQEPSANAAQQAKQQGLSHVGFGRYMDQTNQVSHIAQNDKLVPFKRAVKSNEYRVNNIDDVGNLVAAMSPAVEEIANVLTQLFTPEMYDDEEVKAIKLFTISQYAEVNELLATLPSDIPAKQIEPHGPNDSIPDLIFTLDSAMRKSRSPIEFIGYTKIDMSTELPQTFKFKGYRSISLNLSAVLGPEDDDTAILQIRMKKNMRGIYAANFSNTPDEAEFILPRGTTITVAEGPVSVVASDLQIGGSNRNIIYYDCVAKS